MDESIQILEKKVERSVFAGNRAAAAKELGKTGDSYVVPILLRALEDSSPKVKAAASEALGILSRDLEGFTEGEFDSLNSARKLDSMIFDGEEKFEKRFDKNLLFTMPEYEKRLKSKNTDRETTRVSLHKEIDRLIKFYFI